MTKNKKQKSSTGDKQLDLHSKWQDAANKMNRKQHVKLILKKDAAQEIIYDFLKNVLSPKTINDIYKELKGTVPPPLIKSCLDSMSSTADTSQNDDTDDDDDDFVVMEKSRKDIQDPFAGTILTKCGKTISSTLYYINQSTLYNEGNGLKLDERHDLITNIEKSKLELNESNEILNRIKKDTVTILSQPTNESIEKMLQDVILNKDKLNEAIQNAKTFHDCEKERVQFNNKIQRMIIYWKKRRRLCMDFLHMMEESTDGVIKVKSCLAGNGQIDLDSDESIIKVAQEVFQKKTNQHMSKRAKLTKDSTNESRLIGVNLDKFGRLVRVYPVV